MNRIPEIKLSQIYHRDQQQIALAFNYNHVLAEITRGLPSRKWSVTKKVWYVQYTTQNLALIYSRFKDKATINSTQLDNKKNTSLAKTKNERVLNEAQKLVLNNFYKYLKGKRYSDSTVNTYTYLVADFISYYTKRPIFSLSSRDVELFIETIYIKRKYSISTQRQFISALKLFIVFEPSTQILELELVRPRKDKKLPVVLSQQEVIGLISVTKNLKHRAIIALLYSAGLRISELINLKIEDININRRQILVKNGKGRKDRLVTLATSFMPLLQNYFITYKPSIYYVEGPEEQQYTASSVRKFLYKNTALAGIKVKVTPHTLRHSYATHLLENGVGLRHIQELLGHSKPETTMIYTHVARKDLLEIKSPLDFAVEQLSKVNKEEQKFRISGN